MNSRRWLALVGVVSTLALSLGLGSTTAKSVKKPIDWATVHPAYEGAAYVNDRDACLTCHEDAMKAFEVTAHGRVFRHDAPSIGGECESCHGPRSKHLEEPSNELAYASLTMAQQSAICQQCHSGGTQFGWKSGAHHAGDVSCGSCHNVMEKKSERALLVKSSQSDVCYTCHAEIRADTMKPSHHPVREGQMECSSCHNVHGATPGLLVKSTLNETCTTCHAEKRGPFLWEHAPVRESCANCHTPHGSNQRFLLTAKDPFLCLSCHSYGGHINLPRYNRTSNPYGHGCMNCHVGTHGSNHPSGAKQMR